MIIQDLKNRIANKDIPKTLIFIDDNPYLVSIYMHRIEKALNLPSSYYGDIEEAISDARIILADECIYIVTLDSKSKILSKEDKFKDILDSIAVLDKYFIVILPSNKKIKNDNAIIFAKSTPLELTKIVEKTCELNHFKITNNAIYELIKRSDCDLGVIMNVLEQLKSLGRSVYDIEDIPSYDYRKGDIFTLIDKIISRDKNIWEYVPLIKDSPSVIAYNLYAKAREKATTYSNASYYIGLMRIAEEVYRRISDGTIKDTYALKYLIIESQYLTN